MMNQVLKTAVCFKSMTTAIGTKNKTLFDTAHISIHTHISIQKVMTVKMCRCVCVCVERKGMKTLKKCLHSVCLSECEVFFFLCFYSRVSERLQLCFAPSNLKSSKPYRNQLLRLFIGGIADVDTFSQLTHTHSHAYIYRDVPICICTSE